MIFCITIKTSYEILLFVYIKKFELSQFISSDSLSLSDRFIIICVGDLDGGGGG